MKYGLTWIGASPYMINFDVMLETNNLEVGQNIACKIRERTGSPSCGISKWWKSNKSCLHCWFGALWWKNPQHKKKEKGRLVHVICNYFTTHFPVIGSWNQEDCQLWIFLFEKFHQGRLCYYWFLSSWSLKNYRRTFDFWLQLGCWRTQKISYPYVTEFLYLDLIHSIRAFQQN